MSDYKVAKLDEIPRRDTWIPVRDTLGVQSFGVNAYRGDEAGGRVINDHIETIDRHEELYIVTDGRATFTLDGEEFDAPAGTLVFVAEPTVRRAAVAAQPGTTVLVAGGPPGRPYTVAPWEESWEAGQEAMARYREQDYRAAADLLRVAVEENPKAAGLFYNLACFESLAGADPATVTEHLRRAIELYAGFGDFARDDSDFAPVRDDPGFQALLGDPPPRRSARPTGPATASCRSRTSSRCRTAACRGARSACISTSPPSA